MAVKRPRQMNAAQRAKKARGAPLRPGLKFSKTGQVVRDPNRGRVARRRKAFKAKTGPYKPPRPPRATRSAPARPVRSTTPRSPRTITQHPRSKAPSQPRPRKGNYSTRTQRHGYG